jgi:RNA-directed DNA polymerase
MAGTPTPETVSTKLVRIAELAKRMPGTALRTLAHHIDIAWLKEAHARVRKDGALGVDGQTAEGYAKNLEGNLHSLLERAKSGDNYRAPPVRRVYIPKGNGKSRPLGIPTFEDKVLQKAVAMVLEAVYEQDFMPGSYGFRPEKSAHQALQALWKATMSMNGGWVLEADIEKFFDTVDHAKLRDVLSQRVCDGVLTRLIGKWLNAGVMEEGRLYHPEAGTPQGGVISPLLANIYLHEVLDVWWTREVKPRLRGKAELVRYADDFVMVFEIEEDARKVAAVLPKRFEKYGLRLHPEKTRLVRFTKPTDREPPQGGSGPESFDLLGFTHFWGKSLKGNWVVRRKTAKDRLSRTLKRISEWCSVHRHAPIDAQHKGLTRKLRGHDAYFGITGNARALSVLRYLVTRIWHKWLARRSWKGAWTWTRMNELLKRLPLPPVRVVHSIYRVAKP